MRRPHRFEVRLSTDELKVLRQAARELGLPASELVRNSTLEVARALLTNVDHCGEGRDGGVSEIRAAVGAPGQARIVLATFATPYDERLVAAELKVAETERLSQAALEAWLSKRAERSKVFRALLTASGQERFIGPASERKRLNAEIEELDEQRRRADADASCALAARNGLAKIRGEWLALERCK